MTTTNKSAASSHQQQLDRLEAEVHSLRQQLRRSQRLAAVGTMTAMVAHEFNNILTPVVNYAQMAQSNPKFSQKAVATAADGGQRATEICNAILGITHSSCSPAPVKLGQLVAQTLSAMARDPVKDGIALSIDIPANLEVTTCRVELQQVLLNLILNARSAVLAKTGPPREIQITARRSQGAVHVSVRDSGVGIAPGHLERIFEPFFSTKPSPTDDTGGGNGLGLFICRQIVTEMGGTISVQSTPGQGATFTLRLPT